MSVKVSGAAGRHEVRHLFEELVELLQRQGIVQGLKRSNWRRSKDSCCLEKRDGVKSEMDEESLSGNPESRPGVEFVFVAEEEHSPPPALGVAVAEVPKSLNRKEFDRTSPIEVWLGNASLFN